MLYLMNLNSLSLTPLTHAHCFKSQVARLHCPLDQNTQNTGISSDNMEDKPGMDTSVILLPIPPSNSPKNVINYNDNPNNTDDNDNSFSRTNTSIEYTNIRNTDDLQPLPSDSTTMCQLNESGRWGENDTDLIPPCLSINNNIDPPSATRHINDHSVKMRYC